ncbi:hypothetical protein BVY04_03700 [bacterium M21]|nr:hypothetical protein BVY04_03700 [bacterium M21]
MCGNPSYGKGSTMCTHDHYAYDATLMKCWKLALANKKGFSHPLEKSIFNFPLPPKTMENTRRVYSQEFKTLNEVKHSILFWFKTDDEYIIEAKEYAGENDIQLSIEKNRFEENTFLLAKKITQSLLIFSKYNVTHDGTSLPPAYPIQKTIAEWDEANLFARVSYQAIKLYYDKGSDRLNGTELTLACLFSFVELVNNGGIGQWLYQAPCDLLAVTVKSLKAIKAEKMAKLVKPILESAGGYKLFSEKTREDHLDSLNDEFHEEIEEKILSFGEIEKEFLQKLHAYTKENWGKVRKPDQ